MTSSTSIDILLVCPEPYFQTNFYSLFVFHFNLSYDNGLCLENTSVGSSHQSLVQKFNETTLANVDGGRYASRHLFSS